MSVNNTTAAVPPQIPATGFCIHLVRDRQEQRAGVGFPRTIGNYKCYWNHQPIKDLSGQIAERGGPGDNSSANALRVKHGKYRLAIQDGIYKTYNYAASGPPRPALLLAKADTGKRRGVLIHPCHDVKYGGYLSSIGCLNPAIGLTDANSRIDLKDSRSRVIAIIDSLKAHMGHGFPKAGMIPDAVILIEGEPT
jgi:hypothetical protein